MEATRASRGRGGSGPTSVVMVYGIPPGMGAQQLVYVLELAGTVTEAFVEPGVVEASGNIKRGKGFVACASPDDAARIVQRHDGSTVVLGGYKMKIKVKLSDVPHVQTRVDVARMIAEQAQREAAERAQRKEEKQQRRAQAAAVKAGAGHASSSGSRGSTPSPQVLQQQQQQQGQTQSPAAEQGGTPEGFLAAKRAVVSTLRRAIQERTARAAGAAGGGDSPGGRTADLTGAAGTTSPAVRGAQPSGSGQHTAPRAVSPVPALRPSLLFGEAAVPPQAAAVSYADPPWPAWQPALGGLPRASSAGAAAAGQPQWPQHEQPVQRATSPALSSSSSAASSELLALMMMDDASGPTAPAPAPQLPAAGPGPAAWQGAGAAAPLPPPSAAPCAHAAGPPLPSHLQSWSAGALLPPGQPHAAPFGPPPPLHPLLSLGPSVSVAGPQPPVFGSQLEQPPTPLAAAAGLPTALPVPQLPPPPPLPPMEVGGVLYGGGVGGGTVGAPAAASSVDRRSAVRSEPETPPGFSQRSPQLHQGSPSGLGPLPRQQQQQGWVSSGSAAQPPPAVAQEAAKPWQSPLQRPSPTVREAPPEHGSPGAAARARLWQAAARSITPKLRPGSVDGSATPSPTPPAQAPAPALAAALPAVAATAPLDAAGQITPGSQQWRDLVPRLLSAGGASWRVILGEGERLGPFTPKQMSDWLLQGRAPPGAGRGAGPAGGDLLICGIKDYSAQKLPGLRFYKPVASLLALVDSGRDYAPVLKADLARGYPSNGWNEPPGGSAAGSARPPLRPAPPPVPRSLAGGAGQGFTGAASPAAPTARREAGKASPQPAAAWQPAVTVLELQDVSAEDTAEEPDVTATSPQTRRWQLRAAKPTARHVGPPPAAASAAAALENDVAIERPLAEDWGYVSGWPTATDAADEAVAGAGANAAAAAVAEAETAAPATATAAEAASAPGDSGFVVAEAAAAAAAGAEAEMATPERDSAGADQSTSPAASGGVAVRLALAGCIPIPIPVPVPLPGVEATGTSAEQRSPPLQQELPAAADAHAMAEAASKPGAQAAEAPQAGTAEARPDKAVAEGETAASAPAASAIDLAEGATETGGAPVSARPPGDVNAAADRPLPAQAVRCHSPAAESAPVAEAQARPASPDAAPAAAAEQLAVAAAGGSKVTRDEPAAAGADSGAAQPAQGAVAAAEAGARGDADEPAPARGDPSTAAAEAQAEGAVQAEAAESSPEEGGAAAAQARPVLAAEPAEVESTADAQQVPDPPEPAAATVTGPRAVLATPEKGSAASTAEEVPLAVRLNPAAAEWRPPERAAPATGQQDGVVASSEPTEQQKSAKLSAAAREWVPTGPARSHSQGAGSVSEAPPAGSAAAPFERPSRALEIVAPQVQHQASSKLGAATHKPFVPSRRSSTGSCDEAIGAPQCAPSVSRALPIRPPQGAAHAPNPASQQAQESEQEKQQQAARKLNVAAKEWVPPDAASLSGGAPVSSKPAGSCAFEGQTQPPPPPPPPPRSGAEQPTPAGPRVEVPSPTQAPRGLRSPQLPPRPMRPLHPAAAAAQPPEPPAPRSSPPPGLTAAPAPAPMPPTLPSQPPQLQPQQHLRQPSRQPQQMQRGHPQHPQHPQQQQQQQQQQQYLCSGRPGFPQHLVCAGGAAPAVVTPGPFSWLVLPQQQPAYQPPPPPPPPPAPRPQQARLEQLSTEVFSAFSSAQRSGSGGGGSSGGVAQAGMVALHQQVAAAVSAAGVWPGPISQAPAQVFWQPQEQPQYVYQGQQWAQDNATGFAAQQQYMLAVLPAASGAPQYQPAAAIGASAMMAALSARVAAVGGQQHQMHPSEQAGGGSAGGGAQLGLGGGLFMQ